jgi:hypothetical protein
MDNKYIKYLIPVIAVVVILESVILITNASKREKASVATKIEQRSPVVETKKTGVLPVEKETQVMEKNSRAELVISADSQSMVKGKKYKVEVAMNPKEGYAIDAVDLYVKFDPEAFDLSNLQYGFKVGKPTFGKISTNKGLVVANFLIGAQEGLVLQPGEKLDLVTFEATPKKVGTFNFEITSSKENRESVTMIVENGENKGTVNFTSNKLNVNVIE